MTFVVDTSVTMAWCFEDEVTGYTEDVLDSLKRSSALAPSHWPLEVANILLVSERRGRIATSQTATFLHSLESLPITVYQTTATRARGPILDLARAQRLSVYDAAYLDLALELGLSLATQDRQLVATALRVGVPLFMSEQR